MAMLPEIIYFYKEEIETIGGCDHSVGICCCNDIKNLELLESYRANMKLKEV
jgi:hypothetical protein